MAEQQVADAGDTVLDDGAEPAAAASDKPAVPTEQPTTPPPEPAQTTATSARPPQSVEEAEAGWLPKIYEQAEHFYGEKGIYGNNPMLRDKFLESAIRSARNNVQIQLTANAQIKRQQLFDIERIITAPLKGTGTGPRDMDELRQVDPKIDDRITQAETLNPKIRDTIQTLLKTNIAHDNVDTPVRDRNYMSLYGMAKNPQSINKFLDVDLTNPDHDPNLELSTHRRLELRKMQIGLGNKFELDPNVSNALRTLRPLLNDAQIRESSSDQAKEHQYNYFVGALAQKITDFQQQHKRAPSSYNELRDIAQPLIRETGEGTWAFGMMGNRLQFEPPDDFQSKYGPMFEKKYGYKPGTQQMGQMYQRFLNRKQ